MKVIVVEISLLLGVFKADTGELEGYHRLKGHLCTSERNMFRCCLPFWSDMDPNKSRTISFFAILKNGGCIATSNDNYDVYVWSLSGEKRVGPPLCGHREKVIALELHGYQ